MKPFHNLHSELISILLRIGPFCFNIMNDEEEKEPTYGRGPQLGSSTSELASFTGATLGTVGGSNLSTKNAFDSAPKKSDISCDRIRQLRANKAARPRALAQSVGEFSILVYSPSCKHLFHCFFLRDSNSACAGNSRKTVAKSTADNRLARWWPTPHGWQALGAIGSRFEHFDGV